MTNNTAAVAKATPRELRITIVDASRRFDRKPGENQGRLTQAP